MAADVGLSASSSELSSSKLSTSSPSLRYRGTMHCLTSIYRDGGGGLSGIQSLYGGFSVAFVGGIVFRGLYLGGYDIAKYLIEQNKESIESPMLWKVAAAQVCHILFFSF